MATSPSREHAELLAVTALGFIAGDPDLLPRFLAITGIEAPEIRAAAAEPGFMAGVLDFLLAHEPSLVAFTTAAGIDPASVQQARRALPGGDNSFDIST